MSYVWVTKTTDEWGCLKVKEVDVIWMNRWGILNWTNNITRSWFLFFFIYVSFLRCFYFYFKESTTVTTDKQRAKRIQQKIYRNVEDKSFPIVSDNVLPIRQCSPFSFTCFKIISVSCLFPFTIKGRELPCSFFFFLLLLPKNKSLSSLSLVWMYTF